MYKLTEVAKTYASDMAVLSDDIRRVVTESDSIITIADIADDSVTITLDNGESILISGAST